MRSVWDDEQVAPDMPLWRYFKVARLAEALQTGTLYFPSARQFEDPFEGAVAVLPHDFPVDPRYGELEDFDRPFEQLRRLTKINCWHCADYESDGMWRLYAAGRKGVAIRTSAERLRAALQPFRLAPEYGEEEPFWGSVRYADLATQRLGVSMEKRFFYKHRAFEWEREFRVAISVRTAEEFAVQVPEFGIDVPFDPTALIEAIYFGPSLEPDERDQLVDSCDEAGVTVQPTMSTLLGRPRYT